MSDQLVVISVSQLQEMFETSLSKFVNHLPPPKAPVKETKFLSRKKVCEILQITPPTLRKHTLNGILKSHDIGRRVLYIEDEINAALDTVNTVLRKKRAA